MKGKNVFVVMRWQSIFGVYETFEDAAQVVKSYLEKGQYCDIVCQVIK